MIDDTQLEGEEDADRTELSQPGAGGELLSQQSDPTEVSLFGERSVTRMRHSPSLTGLLTGSGDETEEGDWHGRGDGWEETDPDGIPGFLLERRLGAGGMGEVYVASRVGRDGDERGEPLALKVLSRVSATRLYRFKREFRTLADVEHPNLVDLDELGVRGDGRAFFTMELLEDARPFVRYVREGLSRGEPPRRSRLERALRQLLEGVVELHRRGYVHRDLKPSNVLVTPEGRVVVLDFGLISTLDDEEEGVTVDGQVVGTPAYMAPEQARGERVGRAADLYAVGVMLYESLTGSKPVDGTAYEQLANKDSNLELDRSLARAPSRLRRLCGELLARDPTHRPAARDLLLRLIPSEQSTTGSYRAESSEPFIGRASELERLREAHERSEVEPVVVHLHGADGLGKSALLRAFRGTLREGGNLILHGRCRVREAVPYKGVDAIIDALSVYLRKIPVERLDELRPREAAALARMFPVLDELWSHSNIRYLNPKELRGVAWAALRWLLATLGEDQQLVLIIDDFHWSDIDSVHLLTELLMPPRPPALLLVLSLRDEVGREDVLEALRASPSVGPAVAERLDLGPLPEAEAQELATLLAEVQRRRAPPERRVPSGAIWAESVALRSGGNPFFITQLVAHNDASVSDPGDLEVFVVRRLAGLEPSERRMLELIAVSGGPIDEALVLELSEGSSVEVLANLRTAGLVVTGTGVTPIPWGRRIEVAHERIRQVTLDQLEPAARAELHAHLGEALLARCEEPPTGELLFLIVDRLTAGVLVLDALEDARRIELARLACAAGECALDMASPDLAQGYFDEAARFAKPWMAPAREGDGAQRELCAAITLGCARTTSDSAEANAVYAELIEWELAPSAYGEVVIDYFWSLFEAERSADAVTVGLAALRKLGFPLPRRPSLRWMAWNLLLGRRAARELSGERLVAMDYVGDESRRAAMRIMALVSWWGTYVGNPFWGIGLAGMHARLVAREGFHELAGLGLCMHSVHLFQGFMTDDSHAIQSALEASDARAQMGATDRANLHMWLPFMAAYRNPFHASVEEFDAAMLACLELGQIHIAIPYFITLVSLRLWSGRQISENVELIAEVRSRSGRLREFHVHTFEVMEDTMAGLLEGRERFATVELPEFEVVGFRYMFLANLAALGLCFDDYERIGAVLDEAEGRPDFQRMMSLLSEGQLYAVASTIVLAERAVGAEGRARRRLRATMRRRRSMTASWAKRCEANWGPMLALIEAEIAATDEHFDAANGHYERARELAEAHHNHWIAGLASQRLARLASRRKQSIVAKAGFEAARESYRSWGAHALVRHLDTCLAGLGS